LVSSCKDIFTVLRGTNLWQASSSYALVKRANYMHHVALRKIKSLMPKKLFFYKVNISFMWTCMDPKH
jgi:hypothetical protein